MKTWNGPRVTEPLAVAAAGPLIHLDEIGLAAALDLFAVVLVPPDVAAEIKKRPDGPGNVALQHCELRAPTKAKPHPMGALSIADVAAIQLAREHDGTLLTDDLDLRDAAHLAGVRVVGTIGIIVRAGRIGVVPREKARMALDLLLAESTLFITPKLVHQAQQALES